MRFETNESASSPPQRRSLTAVLAIVVISAALGAGSAAPARADDPHWQCSINVDCVPGGNVACKVICDHSGCDCDAWDPQ